MILISKVLYKYKEFGSMIRGTMLQSGKKLDLIIITSHELYRFDSELRDSKELDTYIEEQLKPSLTTDGIILAITKEGRPIPYRDWNILKKLKNN